LREQAHALIALADEMRAEYRRQAARPLAEP